MNTELAISKLDTSKRQLETAIRLYFQSGDPVSIHTLTAAAYNVIRDINQKRGGPPMLTKDKMLEFVKPEFQKALRDKINEAENFFKHADRDHNATITFNPAETEMLIMDAASQYYKLTEEDSPLFAVFRGWFMAKNPDLFTLPSEAERILSVTASSIQEMGRLGYFNAVLPVVMRAHA
jgi:glutaredoxin 2